MEEKLYRILGESFKADIKTINDSSSPETIKEWDSFAGLMLVDKLEKEFNVKFTLNEVMDVKNVGDIKRHLRNHGIKI